MFWKIEGEMGFVLFVLESGGMVWKEENYFCCFMKYGGLEREGKIFTNICLWKMGGKGG